MPEKPETRAPRTRSVCGAEHSKARIPEQRRSCGGTCILEKGRHRWHMCGACIKTVEPPEHPAWRDH